MSDGFGDLQATGGWRFSSFRRTIERLIAQTIRVQTNDSAFTGKLADVQTTFITLASTTSGPSVHLTYIPFRHINAVTTD